MKKLLLIGALLCVFCSSSLGNPKMNAAPANVHEGHEWVDLGLSVKWATCNVGASTPGDYGNYYAWGETRTKSNYDYDNCASIGKSWGDIGGDSSRDVATANWGGSWRMPTEAEFQELVDYCNWIWTTQDGHNGYRVTSKINGQSIFLPAAGCRDCDTFYYDDENGFYWSSTPYESNADEAYNLAFGEEWYVEWDSRYYGLSVRPVLDDSKMNGVPGNVHEGHGWVDLGLSVKWATCNLGASTPADYGNYYAWGETSPKSEYTRSNCASTGKSWGDIGGDSSRDAATANWGGRWRMPTEEELQELSYRCNWTSRVQNGHKGYIVTGPNGNSIFLPAAGCREGDTHYGEGEYGDYWSSSPSHGSDTDYAFALFFRVGYRVESLRDRFGGRSVRPVLED